MNRSFVLAFVLLATPAFSQDTPRKISLEEAIRLARKNSPVLGAAKFDVEAARAGARAAKAMTLPQVSANGFATTGNNVSIVGSSPMVEPPNSSLVPTGNFLDGNVSLMVPITAPRLWAQAGSASWQSRAAAGDLAEATADLTLKVTEAYDRVLLSRRMVQAEEAKVAATTELVATTQALFEAGNGIEASVQRSQAELSQAKRTLTSARNDESKAVLDLQEAIGDLSAPIDPNDGLEVQKLDQELPVFVERAKRLRGVIQAARARREAATSDIRAAEGQRFPQLYGTVMGDATNRRDMGGLTAGLTLSFPIFDGGRISAEVSQAKSMRSKADATLRQAELMVEKEVRQAWLDVTTAQANAASAESEVIAAKASYDVTALRVKVGKSILVEQLDALDALTRARADLAQATFDQALAAARLYRATGTRS